MIKVGDIHIHRQRRTRVKFTAKEKGRLFYFLMENPEISSSVDIETAEDCLRDGIYYRDETQDVIDLLNEYEQ